MNLPSGQLVIKNNPNKKASTGIVKGEVKIWDAAKKWKARVRIWQTGEVAVIGAGMSLRK